MRRAWIEITSLPVLLPAPLIVALHAESVDRNPAWLVPTPALTRVALHAESVDRNKYYLMSALVEIMVALHAESVDRNLEKST